MMERTTSEIHVLLHVSSLNLSLSLLRLCLTKPRPVRQYSTHCQSYLLRNSQTFCPNLPTSFRTNQERPPWVCTILSFCRILSQSVPEKCEYLRKKLDDLLWQGIIEESESPWASPIVMVPKSDGTLRLCTDFREVNAATVPGPFPLPRVEDLLDRVGQARYLMKLDMTRGYWQVPLDEESVPISAFVTPFGHFQWRYMPFGLCNAPAAFSRIVVKLLHGLNDFSGAYLDDIINFSYLGGPTPATCVRY